ncbi:hypothetical protein [Bradyrhizobium guangzhouense]|uniref:hypothetical protein n=1 Tax=Bradyrhizobium guangzhouense TaxID=1325095 RepID=UPI0032219466
MERGASERASQETKIVKRVVAGRLRIRLGLVLLLAVRPCLAWESRGGDPGGSRFSPLRQITSDNVGQLVRAFELHTGDVAVRSPNVTRQTKFEAFGLLCNKPPWGEMVAAELKAARLSAR